MKDKKKKKLYDENSFTDLMSRSERKKLEREKNNENTLEDQSKIDSIIKDNEPLTPIVQDITDDEHKTSELLIGELSNSKIINSLEDIDEEEKISNPLSPIPFLFIFVIGCFLYFIYLIIFSDYNNNLFLYINSGFLLLIIIFFGITNICNKKYIKIFTAINIILFFSYIVFNILSIINWSWYQKEDNINSKNNDNISDTKKEDIVNTYICTNNENSIQVNITTNNEYIINLQKNQIFENESIASEMKTYFEDKNGFAAVLNKNSLITEYNFNIIDINEYKLMIKNYNDTFTIDTDFSYITDNKILFSKYKEIELKDFKCTKK